MASPRPSSSGFALIRDKAMCPQTIPAIAAVMKNPQQKPNNPRMLKMSERTASCSLFRGGTSGEEEALESVVGEIAGVAPGGVTVTPGRVESAAQAAAPSYQP